jgi:hypothetical protein
MYELSELQLIRAALDSITIKGADAKFLAQLQTKIESDIQEKTNPPKTKK